ncbi:MAG: hypothetical protein L0Y71_11300 [Gemmataceae bacterium]|nr:hypothetical protein [Gemmataceae bacterium]
MHVSTKAVVSVALALMGPASLAAAGESVRVGVFRVDVSPPLGSPVAYAPARKIEDPLSARGIVLLGAGEPIVLCAVDSIGIGNEGFDQWREGLARAAGTTPNRVAVHVLHQHDAPRHDFTVEAILDKHGLGGKRFDVGYMRDCIQRTSAAVAEAVKSAQVCTHLEAGEARVEKVASNRRILGPDLKVKIVRYSASKIPGAIAAPEGVIDPHVRLVSFWNKDKPIACLSYYACHPQSYYGKGDVTAEFIGLARAAREKALDDLPHIHFNGAGGNVAAGKYNDGSAALRPILTDRVAAGMKAAWEARQRVAVEPKAIEWRIEPVQLPAAAHLNLEKATAILADPKANAVARFNAAGHIAFLRRCKNGAYPVDLTCLTLGPVYLVHMPGELFVEYQLAAQALRPFETVCMAAYGDYAPFYIGTEIAYSQGGYETGPGVSNTAPHVDKVLMDGMKKLLAGPQPRLPRDKLLVYRGPDGKPVPATTVADWAKRRAEVVRGMEAVMGRLPGAEKHCPLDMKIEEEVDCDTHVRRLITYASEPGGRALAYLLIPKDALAGKRKAPAALCLHGTDNVIGHGTVVGLGKANRGYALELAQRGYVTLAPNYPLLAKYQPDLKKLGWESGTLKAVWDNMRGLDLLASLPFVDSSNGFGTIGHSLGGHNSVYTAVFDERLKVIVSSCGLDSYLDYYGGNPKHWDPERGWCQTRYMLKLAGYKGRLADIPFDFHEMIGALAPRHTFIVAPTKDSNFRMDSVDRIVAAARPVFKLFGHEDRLKVEHPDCGHDFPPEMREAAYKLLDEVLAGK